MGTRVPSCGEICKLYIRYFVQIMEMDLKIKVFMKVGTDDEIDEKDAAISFDYFLLKSFWGSIVFDAQASLKNQKVALLVVLRGHSQFGL